MVRPAQPAFLRLDAAIGWRVAPISAGLVQDPSDGTLRLGSVGGRVSPLTEPSGSFGGLTLPTGVAVAPDGVILVADPKGRTILRYPNPAMFNPDGSAVPGFAPLWLPAPPAPAATVADACLIPTAPEPPDPYTLIAPHALAISRDGDVVLADRGDTLTAARLIVFTWPRMVARAVLPVPDGDPADLAFDAAGRLHVADARSNRVRRFDRLYREDVGWPGGAPDFASPRHLAFDRDGRLLVIDTDPDSGRARLSELSGRGRVSRVSADGAAGTIAEANIWRRRFPPPVTLEDGVLFAPGENCIPRGAALRNVTLDKRGRLPPGGPVLMFRSPSERRVRRGTWISTALDGEAFDFAWHRIILDADIPQTTALEVATFTAGHEIEPDRIAAMPETRWSTRIVLAPESAGEVLVQSPPGRYLWLKVGLVGDGIATPTLRSVTLIAPRRSSLATLPAPFHDDPVSRDFLDRFLSYFDTVFDEIEARIDRFAAEIDPRGAPEGAFLAWLAGWFDIAFLAQWDDATRRAFVARAMDLHRSRGTVAGLRAVLRLHLNLAPPMPALIEGFRLRDFAARRMLDDSLADVGLRIAGYPVTGAGSASGGSFAHTFLVVVPEAAVRGSDGGSGDGRAALVRLVDQFRPAHTAWTLLTVEPGIRVGCQSTVGVDTLLGSTPSEPLGAMHLGQSSRLADARTTAPQLGHAVLNQGRGF